MAEFPVMPVRTMALKSDTAHMTAEEFGSYARILLTMWEQGAKLIYDRNELRIIAGVHPARWRKIEAKVLRPFVIHGGYISQKRLSSTFLMVREHRAKQARQAKAWHAKRRASKTPVYEVVKGDGN